MQKRENTNQGQMPSVNLSSGALQYRYFLDNPSGKNGFKPQLGIRYSSSVTNSVLGVAFSLEGLHSIRILPDGRIISSQYGLLVSDGAFLVPQFGSAEVRFQLNQDTFNVLYANGKQETLTKGTEPDFFHLTNLMSSDGETATYEYDADDVLSSIKYSVYELSFSYASRPDPFIPNFNRLARRINKKLKHVTLHTNYTGAAELVRSWEFSYKSIMGRSFLSNIRETGHRQGLDDAKIPPISFDWSENDLTATVEDIQSQLGPDAALKTIQCQGKGRTDLLVTESGQLMVHPSIGPQGFGQPAPLQNPPTDLINTPEAVAFGDVNGRGVRDMLVLSSSSKGVYSFSPDVGFGNFTPWVQFPLEELNANSSFIDVNSDGVVDFIVADPLRSEFRVFLNGKDGWADAPRVRPMGNHAINLATDGFFARISGSVYQDLVKVSGSTISYASGTAPLEWDEWRSIAIDLPPGLNALEPQFIYFADLTGSGSEDLIYQTAGLLIIWQNHGAGKFSAPSVVAIPDLSDDDQILFDDFVGNGHLQALIYCSQTQTLKRLSLLEDVDAGRLKKVNNGKGLTSEISYESTTHMIDSTADAYLPTPRIVVSAKSTVDQHSGGNWEDKYSYDKPYVTHLPHFVFSFKQAESVNSGDQNVRGKVTRFNYIAPPYNDVLTDDELALVGAVEHWSILDFDGPAGVVGNVLSRTEYQWQSIRKGNAISRRLTENSRSLLDENAATYAKSGIDIKAFDGHGNIREVCAYSRGSDHLGNATEQIHVMEIEYAQSIRDRIVDRPCLIEKRTESGELLSATLYLYDDEPYGVIGQHGRVTGKYTYVYSDEQVRKYFNFMSQEDLAKLGYVRISGKLGYWRRDAKISLTPGTKLIFDALDNVTEITFDEQGLFYTDVIDPSNAQVINTPDHLAMKPKEVVAENGRRKTFGFDALGRYTDTFYPGYADPVEKSEYRQSNGKTSHISQSLLDENGRYIQRQNTISGTGDVISSTLGRGQTKITVQHTKLGARGLLVEDGGSETDIIAAAATKTEYDALDRPVKVTKPNGQVICYEYKAARVTVSERRGPSDIQTKYLHYLANGKIGHVALNEQNVSSITHRYNALDQLIATSTQNRMLKETEYDATGRTLATLDPDHGLRILVHDALDNVIETRRHSLSQSDPITLDHIFGLESVPAMTESFNGIGQRTLSTIPGTQSDKISYRYGEGGYLGANLPETVSSPAGKVSYTYTDDNRIASQSMEASTGLCHLGLEFEHLPNGRMSGLTYVNRNTRIRRVVRYEYDSLGRVSKIPGFVKSIKYDEFGALKSITHQNGVITQASWLPDNRTMASLSVQSSAGDDLFSELYEYDFGRLSKTTAGSTVKEFERDTIARLVSETINGNAQQYQYNPGNYLTNTPDYQIEYDGDKPHKLINKTNGDITDISCDGYGRMVSKGSTSFSYNGINQLKTVASDTHSYQLLYDHHAQPALKLNEHGDIERYAPDPRIFQTESGVFGCIMLGNQVLAVFNLESGDTFGVHMNRHGDVVMLSDTNGNISFTNEYGPYGQTSRTNGTGQSIDFHQGFEGKTFEPDDQLYHYGGRVYDPSIGMFTSPDPVIPQINNPLAYNRYVFGFGDPLSAIDPTGLIFDFLEDVGDWIADNWVEILAVVAIVAILVFAPITAPLIAGMAIGGLVGGYAAAQNGQSILSGILVGMALGGLGALGASAAVGAAGLSGATTATGLVLKGALSGAITGAALGLATAYASGVRDGGELLVATLVGAGVGAIMGGIFGYADYKIANMKSPFPSNAKGWEKYGAELTKKGMESGADAAKNSVLSDIGKWLLMKGHPYIFQSSASYIIGPMLLTSYSLLHPDDVLQFVQDKIEEKLEKGIGYEYKKEW